MPWSNLANLRAFGSHRYLVLLGPAAFLALGGCSEDSGAIGSLAFVAVALGGLAAALAFALGRRLPAAPTAPAQVTAAAALPLDQARRLVDALHGPGLLLQRPDAGQGEGWQLRHANLLSQQAWPALGARLDQPLAAADWPSGLGEHLHVPGTTGRGEPWQLVALAGAPGWTLAWQVAPLATRPDEARAAESFGFTLSHDLRAPLRVVEGFTRIVKEDYGAVLDRVGNDHLDRVLGAAARMNLMIDAMLNLAKLSQQPLQRQPVNLSQLAGFVIDDLRRGSPDRLVEVEIESGLVVDGDPTLLRLVLENLLGNAWKYSSKAASPRIQMRREPQGVGRGMRFVVSDNGAGFDMRSADRLFGLFQRLHSASDFPGHGVGLASVRRIVERHDGRIWAESEPGRGASFHVELAA